MSTVMGSSLKTKTGDTDILRDIFNNRDPMVAYHLWGIEIFSPSPITIGGTLVVGLETSLNSHYIISLNPLRSGAQPT